MVMKVSSIFPFLFCVFFLILFFFGSSAFFLLRSYFVLLLWLVIVAVVAVVVDMFIIITDVCIEICSTFVVVVFFLISWGSCWLAWVVSSRLSRTFLLVRCHFIGPDDCAQWPPVAILFFFFFLKAKKKIIKNQRKKSV